MPHGTPQRNGVSEHHNRTLLDMVRSMMYLTDLPLSFWDYALETVAFTLNRAPSKSVETTPYELWFGKKPKLSFLKVWGCDAYVKKLQPDKLEPKSEKSLQESATLPFATADSKGMNGGRQRHLPSAADGKRLRQRRLR